MRSISNYNILILCKWKCDATNVHFPRKNCRDQFVHTWWTTRLHCLCNNYEGVFLKKVPTSFGISNKTIFIVNKEDEYSFATSDILIKLPFPDCGGLFM